MTDSSLRFHGDQVSDAELLDFAVNVWPAPLPASVRAAMVAALQDVHRYPTDSVAKQAIAAHHGRDVEDVVVLNGACEAFWLLAPALSPRHAVCVHPGFTEGEAALRAAGVRVSRVLRRRPRWVLRPDDVPADADLVVLDNPNNPTGVLDPVDTVAALARPGRTLVVDESFIELTEQLEQSMARRVDLPGLIVLRSLTKRWGLAGIRAGYLLAPAPLAAALAAVRQPWSANSVALAAIHACLARDADADSNVAAAVADARADLLSRLRGLPGVRTWPATANFVLVEVTGNGPRVITELRTAGIAVRPAGTFPGLGPDHIRLAVRDAADHERLAAAMRAAVVWPSSASSTFSESSILNGPR
jgi:histidinol-phosphate/aromatic aminotransferase/cobyric acid decarboxylase-like protein